MKLNPAEYVIHMFGGVRATARAIGKDSGTVTRWRKPREMKGTDGRIPGPARPLILGIAKIHGLDITSSDLDFGRTVPGRRKARG